MMRIDLTWTLCHIIIILFCKCLRKSKCAMKCENMWFSIFISLNTVLKHSHTVVVDYTHFVQQILDIKSFNLKLLSLKHFDKFMSALKLDIIAKFTFGGRLYCGFYHHHRHNGHHHHRVIIFKIAILFSYSSSLSSSSASTLL